MQATIKADRRRALKLSVSLMRIWAGVSLLLGAVAAVPLAVSLLVGRTRFAFPGHVLYFGACTIVFIAPAALYLSLSFFVERRRQWAIIAGIVTAGFHGLCAIAGLIGLLVAMRSVGPYLLVPASGAVLIIAACMHLIWSLSRSMGALDLADDQRGFDPGP
jgi:hypothetical protein